MLGFEGFQIQGDFPPVSVPQKIQHLTRILLEIFPPSVEKFALLTEFRENGGGLFFRESVVFGQRDEFVFESHISDSSAPYIRGMLLVFSGDLNSDTGSEYTVSSIIEKIGKIFIRLNKCGSGIEEIFFGLVYILPSKGLEVRCREVSDRCRFPFFLRRIGSGCDASSS